MNATETPIEIKSVRDLAIELPNATRVFEKLGIDYCCGGKQRLDDACRAANLNVDEVLKALEDASRAPSNTDARQQPEGSLSELIDHIVSTHHKFVREESPRLRALLDKVCGVHGQNHPELNEIRATFSGLAEELALHLMKEEQVLFPYIERMEEAYVQHEPPVPVPFGTVQNPIHMMTQEHDSAGEALRHIRSVSQNFTVPADACISYQTLYQALQGFEADLHQHIHKENNLLFPRAVEMESASRRIA